MRISDWSSDVCSSDLLGGLLGSLLRRTLGRLPGNLLLGDLLLRYLFLGNLFLGDLLLRYLPGGLLRRTLGGLLGDLAGGRLANCLLRGLADRFLRRLLGGTFLRSFLRGHEMALLVSGTIGCSSPVQNIAAGNGPTTNPSSEERRGGT